MTDPSPHSLHPRQIGHYDIVRVIGRGGMGIVYLAQDPRLNRPVAIKCLRTELFEPHYRERFKREALLMAKLNHPNIVQIYDFVESADQVALVMEWVDGQNLQTYVREHLVPVKQRLLWLGQIADGLAVAHDAGIIHRDLKPENILINQRGAAKISDLGIAKSSDFTATITDHVAGSYCSMSPEQALGEQIDFRSDLFSFGILAYQLLCGAHPFGDTGNKLQIMQRIISHPPQTPTKHNPDLAPELTELLGQLLSKDPQKRPQNAHQVATRIKEFASMSADQPPLDDTQIISNQTPARADPGHATFDTRFVTRTQEKPNPQQSAAQIFKRNRIMVGGVVLSLFLIGAVVAWQTRTAAPEYIAVTPPVMNAEGMSDEQQELVKSAVYDGIMQSITQLPHYYLIPPADVMNLGGDSETVHRATGADEIITAQIQCHTQSCSIRLNRLLPDASPRERLRVRETKQLDVIVDNYLSIAATAQQGIEAIYSVSIVPISATLDTNDYEQFITAYKLYRKQGATLDVLDKLNHLTPATRNNSNIQNLYRDVSLDLYYETRDQRYVEALDAYLGAVPQRNSALVYNLFQLSIAKQDFVAAEKLKRELMTLSPQQSLEFELNAYLAMARKDYTAAIEHYSHALTVKKTADNLYYLANAYWYSGKTKEAKRYLADSLELAPNYYWAHSLNGIIALYDGDLDAAIPSFQTILQQRPEDSGNINNLGLCYLLKGEPDAALNFFNRAYAQAPDNNTYLLNKADAEFLSKNANADASYRQVIQMPPNGEFDSLTLRNQAQAHAHLGQFKDALRLLKKLEKMDPQNPEVAYTAAIVNTLARNTSLAVFNIEEALNNGMTPIWFSFAWFDELCSTQDFAELMRRHGGATRCSP